MRVRNSLVSSANVSLQRILSRSIHLVSISTAFAALFKLGSGAYHPLERASLEWAVLGPHGAPRQFVSGRDRRKDSARRMKCICMAITAL